MDYIKALTPNSFKLPLDNNWNNIMSNINLIQNTFGVKKARPSKVESYLEVST